LSRQIVILTILGYLAMTGYHPRIRCMLMLSWLERAH
jgi:hypothetical protein